MEFTIIILKEVIVILGRSIAVLIGLVPIPIVEMKVLVAIVYVLEVMDIPLATIIVILKVIGVLLVIIIVINLGPMVD